MPSSFVAQFTFGGGPPPELELRRIFELHLSAPDSTWLPTKRGKTLSLDRESRFLAFCKCSDSSIYGITGDVVARDTEMPDIETLRDLYSGFDYPCWWRIENVRQGRFTAIDRIPGCQIDTRNSAAVSFAASATFAFWDFGATDLSKSFSNAVYRKPVGRPIRQDASAKMAFKRRPIAEGKTGEFPPLFGVDFSGGAEGKSGNAKLWIARWDRNEQRIVLSQGSASNFRRRDLPDMICKERGVWVIDFPFGISKVVADAAGIKSWRDWYKGCSKLSCNEDYLTAIRDKLRGATLRKGATWSSRRKIDDSLKTTWFPLFQQLYRQTISGAADVLYPLSLKNSKVCILPWQAAEFSKSIVSEGFPGAVLTHRLGMDSCGYKGASDERRVMRTEIIKRLAIDARLPLTDEQKQIAIRDEEGDALDALLLLLSAESIIANQPRPNSDDAVEGWFNP